MAHRAFGDLRTSAASRHPRLPTTPALKRLSVTILTMFGKKVAMSETRGKRGRCPTPIPTPGPSDG